MSKITIDVIDLTRPAITFEELRQPDGSYLPGRSVNSAIAFDARIDPFTLTGFHDEVIVAHYSESWKFYGAMLALAPNSGHRPDADGYMHFVMTYSGFTMLSNGLSPPAKVEQPVEKPVEKPKTVKDADGYERATGPDADGVWRDPGNTCFGGG